MAASRPKAFFSSREARSLLTDASEALSVASGSPPVDGTEFEAAKAAKGLGFASARSGATVLANTLLGGSGLLGVPHAFAAAGYGLGLLLLVVFGTCSAFGCHLLQCSARRIGEAPCSFYSVSNAVAPRWTWLIDGAVMVKCFGVATSYLIIVGDLAPPALETLGFHVRRWEVICLGFLVAASLACFRNLSGLKFTAACALGIVLWTTVLITLYTLRPNEDFNPCGHGSDKALPCHGADFEPVVLGHPLALGKALPVFIFAFTCQQNIFTICNEVQNSTCRRIDGIIAAAFTMAGSAFCIAALLGYWTFGNEIASDVLKAYPKSYLVAATRLLYSFVAIFSFPLQIHPSRNSAIALMDLVRPSASGGSARWAAVTVLELAASLAVAITVLDLGNILGVVGATGSTMVSYILPGLVYVQAFPHFHAKRVLAFGMLLLGCVIMPTCLTLLLL